MDVFSTCWRQEGHPDTKSLLQLLLMECTFPPLLFFNHHPFSSLEGHGGMVLKRIYGERESHLVQANPRSPGRMAVKPMCVYRVAQKKTGPPSHCKYSEIPRPKCVEIGGLLQYYMLNTVINIFFKNFIALWRHLAKTQLLSFIHVVQIDLSITQ